MEKYARLASSKEVSFHNLERPNSFFQLLESQFHSSESSEKPSTPLHRIFSIARRHGALSVIIEVLDDAEETIHEDKQLSEVNELFDRQESKRLSFFSAKITSKDDLGKVSNSDFIGYAILRRNYYLDSSVRAYSVFEAVVPPPPEIYMHFRVIPEIQCKIGERFFNARGFPFYQQNGITNFCAHAAIRTLASCFQPNGELTFGDMNDHLNIDLKHKAHVEKGLYYGEISKLVATSGAQPIHADYGPEHHPLFTYQKYIYGSIESGFPGILIFGHQTPEADKKKRKRQKNQQQDYLHAVVIFGHTFNKDMWIPRVEVARFNLGETTGYIPSEYWVGSFIGHDDTLGPYYSIPRQYLRGMEPSPGEHPAIKLNEGVAYTICSLPKFITIHSIQAEAVALAWLVARLEYCYESRNIPWGNRLQSHRLQSQLVLRPIYLSKSDYILHLNELKGWNHFAEKLSEEDFFQIDRDIQRNYIWVVEVSIQELFPANKRKLGELILNPEADPNILNNLENFSEIFIGARLPGLWVTSAGGHLFDSLNIIDISITSHTALYGCQDYPS